jgi:hypothetical protein
MESEYVGSYQLSGGRPLASPLELPELGSVLGSGGAQSPLQGKFSGKYSYQGGW